MHQTPNLIEHDLDMARVEIQASAELMMRSLRESYRLVASAQKRYRALQLQTAKAATAYEEREAA